MTRLSPPNPSHYTNDQSRVAQAITSGTRGSVKGPLALWLHRPALADKAQSLREYCRFQTALSGRLCELAIMLTSRFWQSDYEWLGHKPHALAAGVSEQIIEAIRLNKEPQMTDLEEQTVYDITTTLNAHHRIDDQLAERGTALLEEAEAIAGDLRQRRNVVSGHLRVAAPFGFGRRYVAPLAAEFGRAHPDMTLSLTLLETPTQAGANTFDILVHIGVLRDSGRVLVPVSPNERLLCASPKFMQGSKAVGPDDLAALPCLALRENEEDVTLWRFTNADGARRSVRIKPGLSCNDGEVVRAWALAGHGVAVRSEWNVAEDLKARRLVRVLPTWSLPTANVVALLDGRSARVERTRRFVAALRASPKPPPWRTR